MRLDLFLWYARLAKTRSAAQAIAAGGHLRIDGRRIERAHCPVRVGNVIAYVAHDRVHALRVEVLPHRRGPAPEARACYTDLERANPDAADPARIPPHMSDAIDEARNGA